MILDRVLLLESLQKNTNKARVLAFRKWDYYEEIVDILIVDVFKLIDESNQFRKNYMIEK